MKKLFAGSILLLAFLQFLPAGPQSAFAQGIEPPIPPAPTNGNVVLDDLNWLSPSQEAEIDVIENKLDQEGIAQLAVVTLDNCGPDKKKFRHDLFNTWGIGHASDNDGLLILVCWYGGDKSRRSLEQETGYGMQTLLPDALTGVVARDYFVPAFQANRAGQGLLEMVQVYDRLLRHQPTPQPSAFGSNPSQGSFELGSTAVPASSNTAGVDVFLGVFSLVVLAVIAWMVGRIFQMEATHSSRRQEKREASTIRRLLLGIATLLIGTLAVFIATLYDVVTGIIFACVANLVLMIVAVWHPDGGGDKGPGGDDTGWYSGYGSGGGGGGGGFGGGSSGGGGSSTGF